MLVTSGFEVRKEQIIKDPISNISIDWLTDDICIFPSENDGIRIVQRTNDKFPDTKLFYSEKNQQDLLIIDGRKRTMKIGFNFYRTRLEVYLPQKQWNSLSISTTGGQVKVKDLNVLHCKCQITSGKADLSGRMEELDLRTVGSKITGDHLDVGQLNINSTSSKVEITGKFVEIESRLTGRGITISSEIAPERIRSVSTGAQVMVSIPDNDGFEFKFKKLSGSFKCDFPLVSDGKHLIYLNGKRKYSSEVRGGQFTLRKR